MLHCIGTAIKDNKRVRALVGMSQSISIGNDLKDSYSVTSKWVSNGIDWLSDIEEFYRERANIENEYSSKLQDLCKRFFEKKAKKSSLLSVGNKPQITPGSLECASVVLWNDVLTQTEAISGERAKLSQEFIGTVGDKLSSLRSKCTNLSKHVDTIHEFLDSQKSKVEEDVTKAKKNYDSLCQSTENARQQNEKSLSDKHARKLAEKESKMNIGKNEYLIKINISNRLKDKYYYQDIPELLDYLQDLNESRVALLNKILKNASIVERNSNDHVKELLNNIDSTIAQNDVHLDTAMFIKHNISEWREPADFYFIPSDIWHDDESLVTKEPELTELKRRFQICTTGYQRLEDTCLDAKQRLEEVVAKREAERENLTLSFETKFDESLLYLQTFLQEDSERVKNEVEIEVIQNFAGDKDLSYYEPQKEKKSRFGIFRSHKKRDSANDGDTDLQSINTTNTANSGSGRILSKSGIFNLRRNRHSTGDVSSAAESVSTQGKALYNYDATGSDEVSISAYDSFAVVQSDDGSGWTLIRKHDGSEGLVPTSYIEIPTATPDVTRSPGKKKGPAVAPRRGAKRIQYVQALYDYQADGDDEISISAGDKIALVQDDIDGSGWTQGELNGKTGMFPTSYVQKI